MWLNIPSKVKALKLFKGDNFQKSSDLEMILLLPANSYDISIYHFNWVECVQLMLRYWTESYWWSIDEIRERGKIICPRRFFSRNIKTWYRITYNCAYNHTVKVHPRSHYLSVRLLNFASNILILLSNFPGILSWKLLVINLPRRWGQSKCVMYFQELSSRWYRW